MYFYINYFFIFFLFFLAIFYFSYNVDINDDINLWSLKSLKMFEISGELFSFHVYSYRSFIILLFTENFFMYIL